MFLAHTYDNLVYKDKTSADLYYTFSSIKPWRPYQIRDIFEM